MRLFGHRTCRSLRATAYVFTLSTGIVRFLLYGASGATRGKSVQRLHAEIVWKSCNVSAVAVQSPQPPHGNRTEPVWGSAFARCPCGDYAMPPMTCLRATILQIFFKFVKLLAKLNRRGRGARESVRKSHSRLLPPQGGLAEATRKGEYGQDTCSVDPSQAKCELGINWLFSFLKHLIMLLKCSFSVRASFLYLIKDTDTM